MQPVVRQFVDAGIVTPEVLPGFRAAIDRAMRLRNSLAVELILAVGVFGFGWMVWTETSSLTTSTWYAIVDPAGRHLTLAGRWYIHRQHPHLSVPDLSLVLPALRVVSCSSGASPASTSA